MKTKALNLIYSRAKTPKHSKRRSEQYYLRKAAREMIKYFMIFLLFIGLYIVLHGKDNNSIAHNEYYEVSSEINIDGDFAIIFFKSYEKMKTWLDEWKGEGFYNFLVELYEKELEKMRQN